MGIEIPDADPDGLVRALESYDRCSIAVHPNEWREQGWDGKRNGRVNMVTNIDNLPRVLKDLHGSLNVVQYGYIVVEARQIKSPCQEEKSYSEKDDVYRVCLEPLASYIAYAQFGHFDPRGEHSDKAPVKP